MNTNYEQIVALLQLMQTPQVIQAENELMAVSNHPDFMDLMYQVIRSDQECKCIVIQNGLRLLPPLFSTESFVNRAYN
jgi:hypothetical protein